MVNNCRKNIATTLKNRRERESADGFGEDDDMRMGVEACYVDEKAKEFGAKFGNGSVFHGSSRHQILDRCRSSPGVGHRHTIVIIPLTWTFPFEYGTSHRGSPARRAHSSSPAADPRSSRRSAQSRSCGSSLGQSRRHQVGDHQRIAGHRGGVIDNHHGVGGRHPDGFARSLHDLAVGAGMRGLPRYRSPLPR